MIHSVYVVGLVLSIIILYVIAFLLYIRGISSSWYHQLVSPNINPYILGAGWVAMAVFLGLALYMMIRDMINPILLVAGLMLTLLWVIILYIINDLGVAMWLAGSTFVYYFWLLLYIRAMEVHPISYTLYPILLIWMGFFYYTVHLVSRNQIDV